MAILRGTGKRKEKDPQEQRNQLKPIIFWIIVFIAILYFYHISNVKTNNVEYPAYTDFYRSITNHEIIKAELSGKKVRGTFINGKQFVVHIPDNDQDLIKALRENVTEFYVKPEDNLFMNIIFSFGPILLFFGMLWFLVYRQMKGVGSGAMSFGKSRAKLLARERERVTFEDVAGVDEAKEELQEVIDFLKDPKKFQKLGGKIPKGVLLVGAPGTGKTLLAKSAAGEAEVPFFTISGSDFVEMFVGVGASRVRDMFDQGKKNAPCIIFIDEIDAVGRHRGAGIGGGHDEREQTLNALLVEMDGFDTKEGVIIMAATNRPDVLDPALLRPGRFDRQIVIDLPDLVGREAILEVHSKKVVLGKKVDLNIIARGTPGFTGADLANLINEAALLAARRNKTSISMEEMEEARDKVRWGRERRSRVMDEKDKKITAYHEAGHALVRYLIPEMEPLHKVTIIPRGMAYLGATMWLPEKDKYFESRQDLLDLITSALGGRMAEEIMFSDITSGAREDLKQSTKIARMMVCEWGMSELGPMTFGEREDHVFLGKEITRTTDYSEKTAQEIDQQVKQIIENCYARSKKLLEDNKDKLILVAEELIKKEVLDGKEIEAVVSGKKVRRTRKTQKSQADNETAKRKKKTPS